MSKDISVAVVIFYTYFCSYYNNPICLTTTVELHTGVKLNRFLIGYRVRVVNPCHCVFETYSQRIRR